MNRVLSLAMLSALLITGPAAAGQPDVEAEAQTAKSKEMVCKPTKVLGSRIPVRVCHTRAEWELQERTAQEDLRTNRSYGSSCTQQTSC